MLEHRFGAAFFHFDQLIDELHGAGAIKRDHVDDVIDFFKAKFAASFHHAAGLQLEHAHRFGTVENLEGFGIFERHIGNAEARNLFSNVRLGIVNHGQVFQTKKVHLQQGHILDRIHVELRHHLPFVADGQWNMLVERSIADHHACRMHAGIANKAFKFQRVVP